MKKKWNGNAGWVIKSIACLMMVSQAEAVTVAIDSTASSFIKDPAPGAGNAAYTHMMSIQNYQAGYNKTTDETTRNWFIFDIPTIMASESISSATFKLYMPIFLPGDPASDAGFGYSSADASEEFAIFGLSPDASAVISASDVLDDAGVPDDSSMFDAYYPFLVGGELYGSVTVEGADNGTFISMSFSSAGLVALNGSTGSAFMFGGAVVSIDNAPSLDIAEGLFHHTHPYGFGSPSFETAAPELILEIIPEPSSSLLLAVSGLLMMTKRKR